MTKTQYVTAKNSSHFLSAQSKISLAAQPSITVKNWLKLQLKRPTYTIYTSNQSSPLSLSRLCKMKLHDAADSGKIPSELLPPEMQKSTPVMEDFSITVAGILKLLKNLKPGKAACPDRLKPILLKELCEEIAPTIQVIFECSIQTGKLSAEWCQAQVSLIFKKGDKISAANYRPISLTCILCKVLEHIMASHLVKLFDKHDLLYDLQHGFREKGHVILSLPCCSRTLQEIQVQANKLI